MPGLSRIQRYIFVQNLRSLGLVMGVIILSIILVDTVEQLSTIGTRANISLIMAIGFSLMKLPSLIEQTFPFGLLIAAMLTFRQLSKRAELPVIRASGLSAWTFLAPAIALSLITGLLTMMAISPIGSHLAKKYEVQRANLLGLGHAQQGNSETGIWLRDGDDLVQTIIHAEGIDETGTVLQNARFVQQERILSPETADNLFTFTRRLDAKSARLERGFWQLQNVTEFTPENEKQSFAQLSFSTDMQQSTLIERFRPPAHIGFWQLPAYINASESVGIDTAKFKMRYLTLIALPVMFMAMSLIGSLACLRLVRLGRTAPFIAFGAGSAIILYFINQLGASFGATGAVPPIIAAWSPPVFALFVCLALVAYNEDG